MRLADYDSEHFQFVHLNFIEVFVLIFWIFRQFSKEVETPLNLIIDSLISKAYPQWFSLVIILPFLVI